MKQHYMRAPESSLWLEHIHSSVILRVSALSFNYVCVFGGEDMEGGEKSPLLCVQIPIIMNFW